ncbi:MAG TPA: cytochrome c oxidase subunit 3 [Vicinamibacteria bacterium]|nr:cytochrome c oxidase subunit 3 [Vicinamibacteria bacterium]
MTTPVLDKPAGVLRDGGTGGVPGRPHGDGGGDGPPGAAGDPRRFGLWLFLGTLTMLFLGFSSAYVVRRAGADWAPLPRPGVLWVGAGLLLASTVTLEIARRRLRGWDLVGTQGWLALTGVLGGLFLVAQLLAWRALAAQGVFLATNPHSSFFYVLSGLHALHLVGGLVWFAVALWKVRRMAYTPGEDALVLFATYWHFLTVLWAYLLVLLFLA